MNQSPDLLASEIHPEHPQPTPPQPARRPRRRNARLRDIARHQDTTAAEVQRLFQRFLSEYSSEAVENDAAAPSSTAGNHRDYLLQIDQMVENERTTLHVDFSHVTIYMTPLADLIRKNYVRFSPFLSNAVQNLIREIHPEYAHEDDNRGYRDFYVSFYNMTQGFAKIRDLRTDKIGQLLSIEGTVTRTSEVRPELLFGTFECNDCKEVIRLVEQQFRYTEPTSCVNVACTNNKSWMLRPSESKFVDWQKIRVQESSSEIPPGSMPRTIDIIVRNESVEQCKPGDKCLFTGAFIVVPDVARLIGATKFQTKGQERSSKQMDGVTGIRGMGVRDLSYKTAFLACAVQPKHTRWGQVNIRGDESGADGDCAMSFTDSEKAEIQAMRNTPHLYTKMARCIAPSVYGHDEIKRGILLMLFGGIHKESSESHIGLRGDINICIVGDPSTAKSQFLKFVVSLLPRAVYTSGKASTAAGLTASVSRDPDTGEFGIEAGALMLADNGICCIDEFNTMDDKDQVAIHEAMEQQTISIAKAGIQATLNARASILAAANPIGGRYDRSRPLKQNVTLTPPLLSRFDLFFVVLDDCNEIVDTHIAERIVRVHQQLDDAFETEFSIDSIQKYIRYARTIKPRPSPEARERFAQHYVALRQADITASGNNSYRITVRQLESMIRLSEAIARLNCDDTIKVEYVEESARLLKQSILRVESDDLVFDSNEPDNFSGDATLDPDDDQADHGDTKLSDAAGIVTSSAPEQPKQKMKLKFSEYQRIANILVLHLRREADRRSDSTYTRTSLRHWYLDQIEGQITSEQLLIYHTNVITKVIRRLVEVDHVLLESDDDILQVHPNYDISNSQSMEHL